MMSKAPLINNIETWNYFRLFECFIKTNTPSSRSIEDIKKLILNSLFVTKDEVESLTYWAYELDFKLNMKVIKVDGVFYLPINIPGSMIPAKGIGNEYLDLLKDILPPNIEIIYE